MQLHYVNYLMLGSISEFSCMALLLDMYSTSVYSRKEYFYAYCISCLLSQSHFHLQLDTAQLPKLNEPHKNPDGMLLIYGQKRQ